MPAGFGRPIAGPLAFVAIKFFGYSFVAKEISKIYERKGLNPYSVGGVRTGIGLAAGIVAIAIAKATPNIGHIGGLTFLAMLIPFRLVEWLVLILMFYDRTFSKPLLALKATIFGTLCSFALDVPTVLGYLLVGDFWVC